MQPSSQPQWVTKTNIQTRAFLLFFQRIGDSGLSLYVSQSTSDTIRCFDRRDLFRKFLFILFSAVDSVSFGVPAPPRPI